MRRLGLTVVVMMLGGTGCEAPPSEQTMPAVEYPPGVHPTVTVVELRGDDPPLVTTRPRQPPAPNAISSFDCGLDSAYYIALWDGANFSIFANIICFTGSGTATLANFPRGIFGNWQDAVRSWRSVHYNGKFGSQGGIFWAYLNFDGDDEQAVAESLVQHADTLTLTTMVPYDMTVTYDFTNP